MSIKIKERVRNSKKEWIDPGRKPVSGIYYLIINHWSLPKGRAKIRVQGQGKDALELARTTKSQLDAKIALKQQLFPSAAPTLGEFFEDFRRTHLDNVKDSTRESYEGAFRKYIEPVFGKIPLDQIKRQDVKIFLSDLKSITYTVEKGRKRGKKSEAPVETKHLSKDTIRIIFSTLRKIFNEAVDNEIVTTNPAQRMGRVFSEVESRHEVNPLTEEEFKVLLEVARTETPHYFALFACLLYAGLRIGEGTALRWPDVDWKHNVMHIRKTHSRGQLGRTTKTGKTRQVEISPTLFSILKELRLDREKQWGKNVPEFVFCTPSGSPIDNHNLRYQYFSKILKASRLRKIRIHDLRHTFATLHLRSGSPLQWVSRQLGHASVKMTADVYYHYLPDPHGSRHSSSLPEINLTPGSNVVRLRKRG